MKTQHPSTIKHQGQTYIIDRKYTAALKKRKASKVKTAEYSGWKNYETWNVALWWNNDQGMQEYLIETAQELLNDNEGDKETAQSELADVMKDYLDDLQEEFAGNLPGPFSDLLNAAIGEVDFREIAGTFLEDLEYEGDEEEE